MLSACYRAFMLNTVSWEMAEQLTRHKTRCAMHASDYGLGQPYAQANQAVLTCPVQQECQAYQMNTIHLYPVKN